MLLHNLSSFFSPLQVPTSLCSNVCPTGTRRAQIRGKPVCCFDCLPCAEGTIANFTGRREFNKNTFTYIVLHRYKV